MWNPSTCSCECDKYCEVGQYLDYQKCACRKKLIDDLIEQCTTVIDMEINNGTGLLTNKTSSRNIYLFLFVAVLIISLLLAAGVVYYCRKDNSKKFEDKI